MGVPGRYRDKRKAKSYHDQIRWAPIPQASKIHGESMIRAILKRGKIQPVDELPPHWREGQELIVEGCAPSDDPAAIKKWHDELVALSAEIPAEDYERMATAIADQ